MILNKKGHRLQGMSAKVYKAKIFDYEASHLETLRKINPDKALAIIMLGEAIRTLDTKTIEIDKEDDSWIGSLSKIGAPLSVKDRYLLVLMAQLLFGENHGNDTPST